MMVSLLCVLLAVRCLLEITLRVCCSCRGKMNYVLLNKIFYWKLPRLLGGMALNLGPLNEFTRQWFSRKSCHKVWSIIPSPTSLHPFMLGLSAAIIEQFFLHFFLPFFFLFSTISSSFFYLDDDVNLQHTPACTHVTERSYYGLIIALFGAGLLFEWYSWFLSSLSLF